MPFRCFTLAVPFLGLGPLTCGRGSTRQEGGGGRTPHTRGFLTLVQGLTAPPRSWPGGKTASRVGREHRFHSLGGSSRSSEGERCLRGGRGDPRDAPTRVCREAGSGAPRLREGNRGLPGLRAMTPARYLHLPDVLSLQTLHHGVHRLLYPQLLHLRHGDPALHPLRAGAHMESRARPAPFLRLPGSPPRFPAHAAAWRRRGRTARARPAPRPASPSGSQASAPPPLLAPPRTPG